MIKSSEQLSAIVQNHLFEGAEIRRKVAEECPDYILEAAKVIAKAFNSEGKLLLCGNGGSAADCQHLATEFVNQMTMHFRRPGLPAVALTTDTSFLTAVANDYDFEQIFERQVQALGTDRDVLLGISTSGNSSNVMRAVKVAQEIGMRTIALTGRSGRLKEMAEITIAVPSQNTQYIQEAHLAIEHLICELVEYHLYGEESRPKMRLA